MPGYRYEAINAYLHMSDPAADVVNDQLRGQPGHGGLFRLKPIVDDLLTGCRAHYHPYKNMAVDERMVATKARIGMKQHMKDLSDALIKYFSVTRKTKQCYMKLFLYFIDIAVVNSFIIFKEMAEAKNQQPLDQ